MSEWFSLDLDYGSILLPRMPLAEILLRGTFMYLALCFLLRVVPKRNIGSFTPTDLLILLLIVEVSGNAASKNEMSISDALLTVAVVQFWGVAIDWLSYHYPKLRPILEESPSVLIRSGRPCRAALRAELISREELLTELRKQGVGDIESVQLATLESDGSMSIVKREDATPDEGSSTASEPAPADPATTTDGSAVPPMQADPTTERGLNERISWHDREIEGHLKEVRRLRAKLREQREAPGGKKRKSLKSPPTTNSQ
jgi:uncharacterized membrane protein YcaP (DUF421 family)